MGCHNGETGSELEALRDEVQRLRAEIARRDSIASAARCVIWEVEPPDLCTFISPSTQALLGFTPEMIRTPGFFRSRVHHADHERLEAASLECLENDVDFVVDFRMNDSDDREVWMRDYGRRYVRPDGTKVVRGVLLENRKRLADGPDLVPLDWLLSTLPVGIYLTNILTGENIYCNPTICNIVGMTQEQIAGLGETLLRTLVHPEDVDRFHRDMEQMSSARDEDVIVTEVRILNSAKIWQWFALRNIVWQRLPSGEVSLVLGVLVDISQTKASEQTARRAHRRLEARVDERTHQLMHALEEVKAFSYSVSHDLRAPLRSINSSASTMLADYGDYLPEQAVARLERIKSTTLSMDALINGLLSLSRLTTTAYTPEPVDLGRLANECFEELSPIHSGVEFTVAKNLPIVVGEPPLLRQALTNLLSNACKFTVDQSQPKIAFEFVRSESGDHFELRDNGVGFDPAYSEKIFGVFERLNGTSYPGQGIGLALVRRIFDRNGGHIWADGRPNDGASFRFRLPLFEHTTMSK